MRAFAFIKLKLQRLFLIIHSNCEQDFKESMENSKILIGKLPLKSIHTGLVHGNGVSGLMTRAKYHKLNIIYGLGNKFLLNKFSISSKKGILYEYSNQWFVYNLFSLEHWLQNQ